MRELIIDEEFRFLLPALDKNTYAHLEENLLENGIRDPIVVWEDIIIDGHNRYSIAMKHEIPFNIVSKEFRNRSEAIIWIISTQVSRRNLTPIQLSYFRGLHYNADRMSHGDSSRFTEDYPSSQNENLGGSTITRLSKQYNVSRSTISRDSQVANAIDEIGRTSPEAKMNILSGAASITRKQLNELRNGSGDALNDTILKIEDGTFQRRPPASAAPIGNGSAPESILAEIQRLDKVIIKISADIHSMKQKPDNGGTEDVGAALRTLIDTLEELYRSLAA